MAFAAGPGVRIRLPLVEHSFGLFVGIGLHFVHRDVFRDAIDVQVGTFEFENTTANEVGAVGGVFDVLVGINLLREGLDMPEVSLVAILDADKEGFLRSERSLIQTIGRAARNVHGKALLYADKITGSMRKAIDETNRRRERQVAFNEKHGIKPTTIVKQVADIMEAAYPVPGRGRRRVAEDATPYESMSPEELLRKAQGLEKKMLKHARDLEFEEAARLRDEIHRMREIGFGLPDKLAG